MVFWGLITNWSWNLREVSGRVLPTMIVFSTVWLEKVFSKETKFHQQNQVPFSSQETRTIQKYPLQRIELSFGQLREHGCTISTKPTAGRRSFTDIFICILWRFINSNLSDSGAAMLQADTSCATLFIYS